MKTGDKIITFTGVRGTVTSDGTQTKWLGRTHEVKLDTGKRVVVAANAMKLA